MYHRINHMFDKKVWAFLGFVAGICRDAHVQDFFRNFQGFYQLRILNH